jgi:hypothetical protein
MRQRPGFTEETPIEMLRSRQDGPGHVNDDMRVR